MPFLPLLGKMVYALHAFYDFCGFGGYDSFDKCLCLFMASSISIVAVPSVVPWVEHVVASSAVHATFVLEAIPFCHGKLEHIRGIFLVAFAIFERRRGHVGHEEVRCQRRHPFVACEISSGRRTDVDAGFCNVIQSGMSCKLINDLKSSSTSRWSR